MAQNRVILSYALDWFIIIAASTVALLLANVNPDSHTFCVLDMSISYPHRDTPKVPLWLLIVLAVITPAALITITCLHTNSQTPDNTPSRIRTSRTRLHNLNTALLGLGISLGTATIICTGVKNLTGKPRPDFLAMCQPDLNAIEAHTVGGFGHEVSRLWVMLDRKVCQEQDRGVLNDALRSFPSGYATGVDAVSFAGLWYLSLWLCGRFGVGVHSSDSMTTQPQADAEDNEPLLRSGETSPIRAQASQPKESLARPVYFLFLPYIPLGLAIFIAGTRYFDFRNHGWDVVAGAAVGSLTAWFGFRWHHPSLSSSLSVARSLRYGDRQES